MKNLVEKIGNVDFELTYSCNLKCLHCYNPENNLKEHLNIGDIIYIIDKVRTNGFEEIHITGGEPLKHANIFDILQYTTANGLKTILETNATIISNFDELARLNNFYIRASIEGPEEIHNIIRRTKSRKLNPFKASIENLVQASEKGIAVEITTSVNKINHAHIYDMAETLVDNGLDNIRLRLSMPASYAFMHWRILEMNREEYQRVLEQAERIKDNFPKIYFKLDTIKRASPKIQPKFFIDPKGDVKPYPFIEHYVGNMLTEDMTSLLHRIDQVRYPINEEELMNSYLKKLGIRS